MNQLYHSRITSQNLEIQKVLEEEMLIHDWEKYPLKYDPNRGYALCKPCWNGQHWDEAYLDANGTKHPKVNNCLQGGCGCGCRDKGPKKVKFTGEGQLDISMENPIVIK